MTTASAANKTGKTGKTRLDLLHDPISKVVLSLAWPMIVGIAAIIAF